MGQVVQRGAHESAAAIRLPEFTVVKAVKIDDFGMEPPGTFLCPFVPFLLLAKIDDAANSCGVQLLPALGRDPINVLRPKEDAAGCHRPIEPTKPTQITCVDESVDVKRTIGRRWIGSHNKIVSANSMW